MAADVQLSFSCLVFLLIFSVNSIIIGLGISHRTQSDTTHKTTRDDDDDHDGTLPPDFFLTWDFFLETFPFFSSCSCSNSQKTHSSIPLYT